LNFKEILPTDSVCPLPDSQDVELQDVWRFLESKNVSDECFFSHSKLGKPVHPEVGACRWASCSLFVGDTLTASMLKTQRFKRFAARALLSIPVGSGKSLDGGNHIDFWAFDHFDFAGAVQKVVPK
jgi:hypothetical protein